MRPAAQRSNKLCCARTPPARPSPPSTRLAHRILPVRASIRPSARCRPARALRRLFSHRLLAARLRPLIEVGHAAIQDWRDSRIRLRSFLGLVRNHRILDEAANQALQRIVSALELRRMMYRSGWTRFAAQPAVHALGDVYIELRQQQLPRLLILVGHDDYAIDRTGALARQAACADFEIDIQDPAITERQRVLH